MLDSKIKQDKRILRKINYALAYRSLWSLLVHIILFTALTLQDNLYTEIGVPLLICATLLLPITALHVYYTLRFEHLHAAGPKKWAHRFFALNFAYNIIWSLLICLLLVHYGLSPSAMVLLVYMLTYSGIRCVMYATYLKTNKILLGINLIPMIASCILLATPQAVIIAIILSFYYWVLSKQAEYLYQKFWARRRLISDNKTLSNNLALKENQQNRAGYFHTSFFSKFSYEIRIPMNNILGMLSMLNESDFSEEQKTLLNVVVHSSRSLIGLLDDLTDLSKIVSKNFVLNSTIFNIRRCLESALEILAPMAHKEKIEISNVFDSKIPLRVYGDISRIKQVIENLTTYVIQHSTGEEIIIEVYMAQTSNTECTLRIHITSESTQNIEIKKLIELLNTDNDQLSLEQQDLPLGLTLASGLIHSMGGKSGLLCENGSQNEAKEIHERVTLWFTLPLKLSSQQVQQPLKKKLTGQRVLIVDATKGMVQALINDLRPWDAYVESIEEGYDKALQLIRDSERQGCGFDMIILNLSFKYVGTFKLSEILSEDPALQHIKQLILTTLDQKTGEHLKHHLENKAPNALTLIKPIQKADLHNAINRLFSFNTPENPLKYPFKETTPNTQYNILLVEDNHVNQMVAKGMLKRLGYQATAVSNGKEALSILADKKFHLILMDCMLPELDGYEATKAIRKKEIEQHKNNAAQKKETWIDQEHLPIIALTANSMSGEAAKCLAAGMDDYLAKPITLEQLNIKLKLWLNKSTSAAGTLFFHE